jgi:hypothetical protein
MCRDAAPRSASGQRVEDRAGGLITERAPDHEPPGQQVQEPTGAFATERTLGTSVPLRLNAITWISGVLPGGSETTAHCMMATRRGGWAVAGPAASRVASASAAKLNLIIFGTPYPAGC